LSRNITERHRERDTESERGNDQIEKSKKASKKSVFISHSLFRTIYLSIYYPYLPPNIYRSIKSNQIRTSFFEFTLSQFVLIFIISCHLTFVASVICCLLFVDRHLRIALRHLRYVKPSDLRYHDLTLIFHVLCTVICVALWRCVN